MTQFSVVVPIALGVPATISLDAGQRRLCVRQCQYLKFQ
jgi:hypothetical protein